MKQALVAMALCVLSTYAAGQMSPIDTLTTEMKKRNYSDDDIQAVVRAYKGQLGDDALYDRCVLKNNKPGMTPGQLSTVKDVCYRASIPKKCRSFSPWGVSVEESMQAGRCVMECEKASYWTRTFGECSASDSP